MSKAASKNRAIAFATLYEVWRLWRTRPNRRRKWQVIATFGGATFPLYSTRENELHEKLAGKYSIVYIDSVNGFVFVDDGSRPGNTSNTIKP